MTESLYLKGLIIPGIFFIILLLVLRKSRRIALIGGLGAAPFGLLGFVFDSVWNPVWITNGIMGPEDFLFCFLAGGIIIALSSLLVDFSVFNNAIAFKFKRMLLTIVIGACFTLMMYNFGIRNYLNSYLSMILVGATLIVIRTGLWKILVAGSLVSLLIYSLISTVNFYFWPDLIHLWIKENLSGLNFFGVPCEELIWAFLFGGSWPAVFLYVIGPSDGKFHWKQLTSKKKP